MANQITGNAGFKGAHFDVGEDSLSIKVWGAGGAAGWGTGGVFALEECEDDPLIAANWQKVPLSELDNDGGYNMSTGIKFMRPVIDLGTTVDLFYVIKRFSRTGEVTT